MKSMNRSLLLVVGPGFLCANGEVMNLGANFTTDSDSLVVCRASLVMTLDLSP